MMCKKYLIRLVLAGVILAAAISGTCYAYDSEKTHPELTNETLTAYESLYGSVLPNGVDLSTKISGEIVTKDGQVLTLNITVREWIILGSAEEDWGGSRADAHYYDPKSSTHGRTFYQSGAAAWIHDSAKQSGEYVAASGQEYASGDYTFETFRNLFFNFKDDARSYRALGHLLHVIQDMASPPHVRGGSDMSVTAYEGVIAALYGSEMLDKILQGQSADWSTTYLARNRSSLGLSAIKTSDIPDNVNIEDYISQLAAYTNENYFSPGSVYSSSYSLPAKPSVPPATSDGYSVGEYRTPEGAVLKGYYKGGDFMFSKSMINKKNGSWDGKVIISPAAITAYYQRLALKAVVYGIGIINNATNPSNLPQVQVTSPTGVNTGNVQIDFKVRDYNYSKITMKIYYSEDGGTTFKQGTVGPGGVGTSEISATPNWVAYTIYWNTDADIGGTNQDDIQVKLIPSGVFDGVGQTTSSFTLLNENRPPNVLVNTPAGEYIRYVTVSYVLYDIDSDNAGISVYFSTNGGASYSAATQGPGGDGLTGLSTLPDGVTHNFSWDTLPDIGTIDTDSVVIKIVPSDASGTGKSSVSNGISVRNKLPTAADVTAIPPLKGDLSFSYNLIDAASSLIDISVSYSINGGLTFIPATAAIAGDGTTSLSSSPTGTAHTYVWNSVADLGLEDVPSVILKITPSNSRGEGTSGESAEFAVSNMPYIEITAPAAGSNQTGPVTVTFTIYSPMVLAMSLTDVEYSLDNGVNYYPCTQLYGDDTSTLTGTKTGSQYSFIWDSEYDISYHTLYNQTSIRITESFGGKQYVSNTFSLQLVGIGDTPWPKRHGPHIGNNGRSPYSGPQSNALKWSGEVWVQYGAPVIGKDGTIYIGGRQTTGSQYYGLFAVNPWDGSIKWFLNCNQSSWPITAAAISKSGRIYYSMYGTYGGNTLYHLYCIEDVGGSYNVKWTYNLRYIESAANTPNIDTDGTIYIPGRNSSNYESILAITDNGVSASEKWAYCPVNNSSWSNRCTPAISTVNNTVYGTRSNYGYSYGISRTTGASTGNTGINAYNGSVVVPDDEGSVYSCDGYYLRRLNTASSGLSWSSGNNYASGYYNTPAIGYNGTVYFGGNSGIWGYNSSNSQVFTHAPLGTAVRADDLLIDKDGYIYLLCAQYAQCIRDNGGGTGMNMWNYSALQSLNYRGTALGSDGCWIVPGGYNNASYKLRSFGSSIPTVYTVAPASMATTATKIIKIYGGAFKAVNGTNATSVKLEGSVSTINLLTFSVKSYTTIYAEVPAGTPADTYDVIVTNANGANTTSVQKLTITP